MADRNRKPARANASRRGWRTYAALAVAVVVLLFVLLNSQKVEVDFILATTDTPLFFVIVVSVGLGWLIGWLLPHVRRDRRRERNERDRHDDPGK